MMEFKKQEAVKYEKGDAPRIDAQYDNREWVAELVKIEPFKSKEHPDWAPSAKFIFRILEEPFVGAFASGLVTTIWATDNKLDQWLTAMGVNGADLGATLTSDQLKKKVVRITVKLKDGFANVTNVGVMVDRDFARIAPGAQHGRTAQAAPVQATQPAPAPAAQAPVTQPAGGTQPVATPAPINIQPQGQVTKDASIPF